MSRKFLGNSYDKSLKTSYKILDPIKRIRSSSAYGHDIWNAYEFTYLDKKNLPVLKVLEITIPADSKFIVESKSLKIYLNSFYDKKFVKNSDVLNHIKKDLNKLTKSITKVRFLNKFLNTPVSIDLNSSNLLITPKNKIICFTGFRSICPVTSQPDFANIYIKSSESIEIKWITEYLKSYKEKGDFHEQCVESIYQDIASRYNPKKIEVCGRFMRRGGIDINPIRSSTKISTFKNFRFFNQ